MLAGLWVRMQGSEGFSDGLSEVTKHKYMLCIHMLSCSVETKDNWEWRCLFTISAVLD